MNWIVTTSTNLLVLALLSTACFAQGKNKHGILSPDKSKIVYMSTEDGDAEIFIAKPDGSKARQLTKNEAIDNFPVWHPDSSRIAFASNRSGKWQIYEVELEGFVLTQISSDPSGAWDPKYSTKGKLAWLAFKARVGKARKYDLVIRGEKTNSRIARDKLISDFAWNPGGDLIACGQTNQLELITPEKKVIRRIPLSDIDQRLAGYTVYNLVWRNDGKKIGCKIVLVRGQRVGAPPIFGDRETFLLSPDGDDHRILSADDVSSDGELEWLR